MCRLAIAIAVLAVLAFTGLPGQESACRDCPLPGGRSDRDTIMNVRFHDLTTLYNVVSAQRVIARLFGQEQQGLRLQMIRNGVCVDTVVPANNVSEFMIGGLGIGGQPLMVPVGPAREFYREQGRVSLPTSFLDITPLIGFGGSDESTREIGFDGLYYGAELLWAPLGDALGDRLALAVGGGLTMESNRLRFPVQGHLRWTFLGGVSRRASQSFVPGPCQFGVAGLSAPIAPIGDDFIEQQGEGARDSTVYYVRQEVAVHEPFSPFLFFEGGIVIPSTFDGHGRSPSINEAEYGERMLGAGLGLPFFDFLVASVGYRYLRLNVRTPCPACPPPDEQNEGFFVTNTNQAHSLLIKIGLHLPY